MFENRGPEVLRNVVKLHSKLNGEILKTTTVITIHSKASERKYQKNLNMVRLVRKIKVGFLTTNILFTRDYLDFYSSMETFLHKIILIHKIISRLSCLLYEISSILLYKVYITEIICIWCVIKDFFSLIFYHFNNGLRRTWWIIYYLS